jgi:hypothetical protein
MIWNRVEKIILWWTALWTRNYSLKIGGNRSNAEKKVLMDWMAVHRSASIFGSDSIARPRWMQSQESGANQKYEIKNNYILLYNVKIIISIEILFWIFLEICNDDWRTNTTHEINGSEKNQCHEGKSEITYNFSDLRNCDAHSNAVHNRFILMVQCSLNARMTSAKIYDINDKKSNNER